MLRSALFFVALFLAARLLQKPGVCGQSKRCGHLGPLALLLLALPVSCLHASTINRSGLIIPTDPQLAFVALGGAVGGGIDLFWDAVSSAPKAPKWLHKWYFRLPVEVVQAWAFSYALQSQSGSVETRENDLNRADCAALGAVGAYSISFGAGMSR